MEASVVCEPPCFLFTPTHMTKSCNSKPAPRPPFLSFPAHNATQIWWVIMCDADHCRERPSWPPPLSSAWRAEPCYRFYFKLFDIKRKTQTLNRASGSTFHGPPSFLTYWLDVYSLIKTRPLPAVLRGQSCTSAGLQQGLGMRGS